MLAFSDIECMTIERFYKNFMKSKGEKKYGIVNLGKWSVNLIERIKFLTEDPENIEEHYLILRG